MGAKIVNSDWLGVYRLIRNIELNNAVSTQDWKIVGKREDKKD